MPQHCKARLMPMAKDVLRELDVCLGFDSFDIAARHTDGEPQTHLTASHGSVFFSKVLKSANLFPTFSTV